MKRIIFILFLCSSPVLFSESWSCISEDELLSQATCLSSNGQSYSFYNDEEGIGINSFFKKIGPNIKFIAETPSGTKLKGITLDNLSASIEVNYTNGDSYIGGMKGPYRHGEGKFEAKDEYLYEGEFFEGWATGKGKKIYLDQDTVVEGDFLNGLPDGETLIITNFIDPDGSPGEIRYEGSSKGGLKNGFGKLKVKKELNITGVGLQIGEYENRFYIDQILPNSPAERSGSFKLNDEIISIKNGTKRKVNVEKLDLPEVLNLLTGKKGRSVYIEFDTFVPFAEQEQAFQAKEDTILPTIGFTLSDDVEPINSEFIRKVVKVVRDNIYHEVTREYEGMFVENYKSGYGIEHTSDGRSYEGTWKNDMFDGFGKRTWGEGNIYFGAYKNDSCEGTGVLLNQDYEITYYGGFHECLAHGYGGSISLVKNGKKVIKSGNFENNLLNGYGEAYYPDGVSYKGFWVNDRWKGHGEQFVSKFGEKKIGTWKDTFVMKDGLGTFTKNNFKYSGEFKGGMLHGKGTTSSRGISPDGEEYWKEEKHVIYENDIFVKYYEPEYLEQEERVALVIGNGAYKSNRLENSVNDSLGMVKTLESYGFKVIHKTNLKQKEFREAIWEFSENINSLGSNVTGLFYYAGHAAQYEGNNFLIPIDSSMDLKEDIELDSIKAQFVIKTLSKATKGVKIIILDACRNDPFKSLSRDISGGLAGINAPLGTFIAYSTAPGALASDGTSEGYGVYTGNLINSLNTPGLTIEQVFKKTRFKVATVTKGKQIPWESSSLIGDFYFSKK